MMFLSRIAIPLMVCAGPLWAQELLPRAEVEALLADHAICYSVDQGACLSGEVYSDAPAELGADALDVTTGFPFVGRVLVLRETVYWDGSTLCLPASAGGLRAAWRQPDGTGYVFELDPADALGDAFLDSQRAQFEATRTGPYCYGFVADGAASGDLAVWSAADGLTGVRARLVPLSEGRLSFEARG